MTLTETSSKEVIDALTKHCKANKDSGYIRKENAKLLRGATVAIRARRAPYTLKRVKGEDGQLGQFDVTNLAEDGLLNPEEDNIDTAGDPKYRLSGAKVQVMMQKLAYHAIRDQKDRETNQIPRTQTTLNKIVQGIEAAFRQSVPDKTVWRGLRKKTVMREARQFMWKAIHDGYIVGTQWMRTNMLEELKARATCKICDEVDSMEHILFGCKVPEQDLIWKLFR
ncbi:hypothetical protein LXA43DRAFT_976617 [Ganoderma leucocontextum]|nr:hypothetical protein LXA43DRAFT_976617 [Ganoderma leucocontextum]